MTPQVMYDKSAEKLEATESRVEVKDPEGLEVDEGGDYSGFRQKTDPVEIKLVRKLDRYIMVSTT